MRTKSGYVTEHTVADLYYAVEGILYDELVNKRSLMARTELDKITVPVRREMEVRLLPPDVSFPDEYDPPVYVPPIHKMHQIKLSVPIFNLITEGKRNFIIHENSPDFRVGDELIFHEYEALAYPKRIPTGRILRGCTIYRVSTVRQLRVQPGYVLLEFDREPE